MKKRNEVPLKVWCLTRDQFSHVKPVEASFGERAEFVYDASWEPAALIGASPDIVICVNDYPFEISRCLDAARAARIPSLVLQDGILEWRCQYENPLFGAGGGAAQHQPVIADKIACLGNQSARQIAAWGNMARVEVTGMARLDFLINRVSAATRRPGTRLLVMTAKNPGFTQGQRDVTLRSLQDVKSVLESMPGVEVVWRVSRNMAEPLGIENLMKEVSSPELVDILDRVDAVITTPSTALLEAMLMGRPVAALDYHNVPRFVPTAWTINAREHITRVVEEILNPTGSKLTFQQDCLQDCLACVGPAAPRVVALMELMIAHARTLTGTEWNLPPRMLPDAETRHESLNLSALYPHQTVFREEELASLHARTARMQARIRDLEAELSRRRLGYGMQVVGRRLGRIFGVNRKH